MTDTTIYIPTYRRTARQRTYDVLAPTEWGKAGQVFLVVVPDEIDIFRSRGYNVLECPAKGIGPTRQWILDQHDRGRYLAMMDDDLRFYKRRFDDPGKFYYSETPEEMQEMLDRMRSMLDQVPLVGLDNRSGANRHEPPVVMNGRMFDTQWFDMDVARTLGIRFDEIEFMEDFNVSLRYLLAGYQTAMLSTHCKGDTGSNAKGGCSEYRNNERQAAAALDLHLMYPEFVRITQKPGWNGDMEGTRTDVAIQWAKTHKAGILMREENGIPLEPEPDWSGLAPEWELF